MPHGFDFATQNLWEKEILIREERNKMRKMKNSGIEWIGEIPEDWECFYLSQIFSQVKNKNIGIQETNLLSLSYGKIIRKNIETTFGLLPENFEGYNIIERDNIVLRLTDLQNDHKSLRVGLVTEKGIITSAYLTLKNKTNMSSNYFYYLLHSFDIAKGFYGMGAGVRQGLNWNEIRSLRIISPKNVPEQQRIADFLDDKVSQIDSVISKTRETIEEYKKLKQSIITEVVTGKVKIENGKVCGKYDIYKDSGVEWIGEIPSEWSVIKCKYLLEVKSGDAIRNELLSSNGKYQVFGGGEILGYTDVYNANESNLLIGRVGARCGCVTRPFNKVFATDNALVVIPKDNRNFLYYVFISFDLNRLNTSNAQPLITSSKVKNITIPVPLVTTQQRIADFLDKKCSEIDNLITKKEQLVVELESYKKSLIYEVVTGKREV